MFVPIARHVPDKAAPKVKDVPNAAGPEISEYAADVGFKLLPATVAPNAKSADRRANAYVPTAPADAPAVAFKTFVVLMIAAVLWVVKSLNVI